MENIKKKHEYLICIDSDGTIMDTMTIKHNLCFGPCFIKTFDIKEHVEDILNHWNDTNLYTLTRGINRFQGLKEILIYVKDKYQIEFDGNKEFFDWVETTKAFSNDLLKEEILKVEHNYVLKKALEWSIFVNEEIKKLPPSVEFPYVKETLKKLSTFADLLGVSSANKDAVYKEWKEREIFDYFLDVACQDRGSKTAIILQGISLGYDLDKVIMLGDAMGDLKASEDAKCLFYPIIPKNEAESWKKLHDTVSELIKNGSYTKEVARIYIDEFLNYLKKGA